MNSLQSRFAKATVTVLILFSLALAVFLDRMFHRAQLQSEENRLKSLMYSLISSMNVENGAVDMENIPEYFSKSDVSVAVYGRETKTIWTRGTGIIIDPSFVLGVGEWSFIHLKKENHSSQIAFGLEWEGEQNQTWKYIVILKDTGESYLAAMKKFRNNLWTWLSLGCLTLLALQLMLLKWGFKPLQQIADEVSLIEQGKQYKFHRLYPSELSPLTTNINSLLRHERGQQLRYQQALDNLAHALKTPLTALKNISQQKTLNDSMLKDIDEQVNRSRDIVDYQLRKASAVGKSPFAKPIQIQEVVEKISRSLQKVYSQKNIHFNMQGLDHASVAMSEGDLFEVIGNIMENAAKYGKSKVEISYQNETLSIEDDGPGFSEKNIQSIVQRGVRQDQRMEGSGIGLSVAYEIISVFGGSLELSKSTVLGGALVKIKFS